MNNIEMKYDKLQTKIAMVKGRDCDKYDYMIAVFCGAVAGLVDCIFVGKPDNPALSNGVATETNSILGQFTDKQAGKILEKYADIQLKKDYDVLKMLEGQGYKGQELRKKLSEKGVPENLKKTGYETLKEKIVYLENKYSVCYDNSVDKEVGLTMRNHHLKSLSHCPDILGLICAIIDQFTYSTTVFQNGQLIQIVPEKKGVELRGTNWISKLYCAVCNWFGHLISDFCGSHSAKGRGMGIPIPFFEVFQFCEFGNISMKSGDNKTVSIAELSVKVFENGYDVRFGAAMAIPVLFEELMIRFLWTIKQIFVHHKTWEESVPNDKHSDLRLMLIVGNATLCLMDGADAFIRSRFNVLEFFLRTNIIAWYKLTQKVFYEIMIRYDFTYEDLSVQFQYLNQQLDLYISKLRTIDYEMLEQQFCELEEIEQLLGKGNLEMASINMGHYIKENNIDSSFSDYEKLLQVLNDPDGKLKF